MSERPVCPRVTELNMRKIPPFIPQEQRDGAEMQNPQGLYCADGLVCSTPPRLYMRGMLNCLPREIHIAEFSFSLVVDMLCSRSTGCDYCGSYPRRKRRYRWHAT